MERGSIAAANATELRVSRKISQENNIRM